MIIKAEFRHELTESSSGDLLFRGATEPCLLLTKNVYIKLRNDSIIFLDSLPFHAPYFDFESVAQFSHAQGRLFIFDRGHRSTLVRPWRP